MKYYPTAIALALVLFTAACGSANITQECVMNGYGAGSCSFTNTGTKRGAVCGKIVVRSLLNNKVYESSKFCSGMVEEKSTTKVEFNIPAVRSACDPPETVVLTWQMLCNFTFLADVEAETAPSISKADAAKERRNEEPNSEQLARESFIVVARDGFSEVDIWPTRIVWRRNWPRADSIVFPFRAPRVSGATWTYDSRSSEGDQITISFEERSCTGIAGVGRYTHTVQIWVRGGRVDQPTAQACANKR